MDEQMQIKRAIRAEMIRHGMTYRDLCERYNQMFDEDNDERTMRNKVARGTFNAVFFLRVMKVLGVGLIDVADLKTYGPA